MRPDAPRDCRHDGRVRPVRGPSIWIWHPKSKINNYERPFRTHTAAGRGDTTPVVNTQQSVPGCDGIRSVGGATMPFALSQGAVASSSIASFELQTFVKPLPLDQLLCYAPSTVQTWPTTAREEILAVAHRDLVVARRNIADFSYYLDTHAAHLAACAGALNDTVPLMSAETFPRLPGGIWSALREIKRDQWWSQGLYRQYIVGPGKS